MAENGCPDATEWHSQALVTLKSQNYNELNGTMGGTS